MRPDYDRSATLAQRVEDAYTKVTVSPYWIGNSECFWYRKEYSSNQHFFFFVNAKQGIKTSAFDHDRLAHSLSEHGIEANANALPFTWIELSSDGKGGLTEYEGDIEEEALKPMGKERPSDGGTTTSASITFVNSRNESVSLFWIDFQGNAKHYVDIKAKQSNRRPTYTGHVWRVTRFGSKEPIVSFVARAGDAIANIEETMVSVTEELDKSAEGDRSLENASRPQNADGSEEQHALRVFVRDQNVWLYDVDGQDFQLSTNGTEEIPYNDEIQESPNGCFAVVNQYTPELNRTVYQIESSPNDRLQPRLKQFEYLKPGDKVRIDRPRMFDLTERKEIVTDDDLFQTPYKIKPIGWISEGTGYCFIYNQRGHQVLRVVGMNIKGQVRSIVEETSTTFVDYSSKLCYRIIQDCGEVIWASERDGWNHLYMFDLGTGELKNQITKGELAVRAIDRVDQDKRQIYIKACGLVDGQDPYHIHLARVNFDGSDLRVITEGDGTHDWKWSSEKKYLVDTWSRVDLAPQTVLINAGDGSRITVVEQDDCEALVGAGWTVPERFVAPGRDGRTLIYGIIIRPSHLDPNQRYPIIEKIYAGPHGQFVPKAFSTIVKEHELAELGFIVVQIDGMDTNWRSKAFHDQCYKNLKDAGLPDRISWIKAAAATRPWMDLDNVGIFGASAGGQSAISAVLHHGDFYKAAVADCGCHDNRMDKLWWNEQWMGWPVDESYENSSNVIHAHKLRGALMLIVGELDDNVDPSSTMQVVNALNKAGKDYDLVYLPGGGHGHAESGQYTTRRQRDFFVKHLMDVKPPRRNKE